MHIAAGPSSMFRSRSPSRAALALWFVLSPLLVIARPAAAESDPAPAPRPALGIIIDDLGDRLGLGLQAVRLSAAVTCAFLPHTPYTVRLAALAHDLGKEVMLHLPMEAVGDHRLGRGGLTVAMDREEFVATVRSDLAAVPHAEGVNNHMGSLLTRHPGSMQWLMEEMRRQGGLYFVDSHTTPASVARRLAQENGVPNSRRDIFLDAVPEPDAIRRQFENLLGLARAQGTAVAIAHPYPETLAFLKGQLPGLADAGYDLLPVSMLIRRAQEDAPAPQVLVARDAAGGENIDRSARRGGKRSN